MEVLAIYGHSPLKNVSQRLFNAVGRYFATLRVAHKLLVLVLWLWYSASRCACVSTV